MSDGPVSKITGLPLPWGSNPTRDGGGSGDPPDDMNARLAALEAGHKEITSQLSDMSALLKVIDAKLDAKASAETVERIGGDTRVALSDMRGILTQKASSTDLARVQGGLDRMPGNWTFFLGLAGFAITIFVAAGFAKHFGW